MKNFALLLAMGIGMAASASAANISLFYTFGSGDNITAFNIDTGGADTSVVFFPTSYALSCNLAFADSVNCGGTITLPTTLDSSATPVLALGADLRYQILTGVVADSGGGSATFNTTGNYYYAGTPLDVTPGRLNFSFSFVNTSAGSCIRPDGGDEIDDPGCSNFSATGFSTPVPEPGSLMLMSGGLIGLGLLARRRRK